MGHIEALAKLTHKLKGVITINNAQVAELRKILEVEQNRTVTEAEAKEFGESLITVYKVLAGDREVLGVMRTEEKSDG